jgi:signal transduction histidine kinase
MQGRRHNLLVVDDEPDVLESLRHLFHRAYRVHTAEAGAGALELLEREDIHVILSDQRMPGMTGDAFLAQARQVRPDAVRMLFTGYADIQAVINAVNEGRIFRYILKPWDPIELEGVIRQAAEQYELLAERKRLIDQLQEANAQLTQANQELAEANILKGAFIEVASHEFNTPITLVMGLSELLRLLNPDRDPREREVVERIAGSARQLGRLVANTLTLMRSEDFRQTLRLAPVPLAELLRDVAGRVEPFVASRHQRFEIKVADDLGEFQVDAAKIGDAVLNLLTNAIKFTPDGGEVALLARLAAPDEAEIVIADRGIGLEPRALKQMFQPFFTEFDPSRHSSGDFGFQKRGLGLGLSIVRQFVELHGGGVSAQSTPGEGTRISLRLPRRPFPSLVKVIELKGTDDEPGGGRGGRG